MPDGASYPLPPDAVARRRRACNGDDWPRTAFAGPPQPYGAIVQHIRANLSRRITVDELAGIARLSVFQLSRVFRREHATTPYRLVLEMRIDQAARMLDAGATIADTAFHTGFADQSHFTRHFKRITGVTPKQYATWRGSRESGSAA
jgi:AraC-like DNA-binding protein